MIEEPKTVGRMIGTLLLAQIAAGITVNFVLLAPVSADPGFLVNAALHPHRLGLSVLIGLLTGAISVGIAIVVFPVFRQNSRAMALWFLSLAVVGLSTAALEQISVLGLLSLSQAYGQASPPDENLFEALRGVVASLRNWAHYTNLIMGGGFVFVFYAVLLRFALIPRLLAGIGLVAVLLQLTAVTLPLFGQSVVMAMLMPLALTHFVVACWLIVNGLKVRIG
jgi:hypothetical protein